MAACTPKGWCPGLDRVLGPDDGTAGFSPLIVMHKDTGARRLVGVRFRSKYRDNGVMLNFCPFCGAEILWEKE